LRTLMLCLLTFHLHLLCDLIGSRGPDVGDFWPIAYSEPLFRHPVWIWSHQWRLDGWQNQLIFAVLFVGALWLAAKKGYSFFEFFGQRLDSIFVAMIRRWRAALSGKKLAVTSPETR
jgi:inner membrane protein